MAVGRVAVAVIIYWVYVEVSQVVGVGGRRVKERHQTLLSPQFGRHRYVELGRTKQAWPCLASVALIR